MYLVDPSMGLVVHRGLLAGARGSLGDTSRITRWCEGVSRKKLGAARWSIGGAMCYLFVTSIVLRCTSEVLVCARVSIAGAVLYLQDIVRVRFVIKWST